jgi:ABC-2 type transport system ATP-binding protein
MRQRLGLAAALLRRPQLLFLDEPTSSLDPDGARAVRAIAGRLADQGTAVVLSSHDMAEVDELCSTLTVIDHGRVVFADSVDHLRNVSAAEAHAMRTSDDAAALSIAFDRPGVSATRAERIGLEVFAGTEDLDAYVLALGRAGVAVRALERRARSLESMFLELTRPEDDPSRIPRASTTT